jgi:hypothetical protein
MSNDATKLPVPFRPENARSADILHHQREWTSGQRGGGKVPADYEWSTNPKQWQEERGTNQSEEAPRTDVK